MSIVNRHQDLHLKTKAEIMKRALRQYYLTLTIRTRSLILFPIILSNHPFVDRQFLAVVMTWSLHQTWTIWRLWNSNQLSRTQFDPASGLQHTVSSFLNLYTFTPSLLTIVRLHCHRPQDTISIKIEYLVSHCYAKDPFNTLRSWAVPIQFCRNWPRVRLLIVLSLKSNLLLYSVTKMCYYLFKKNKTVASNRFN